MSKHTPGPFMISDVDGRHKRVAILAHAPEFSDEDQQPYHPLIGVVYYGGQHAPRATAKATAQLWATASRMLCALKRLELAASNRENTMGDPIRLLDVKAELAAASEVARAVIAKAEGRA